MSDNMTILLLGKDGQVGGELQRSLAPLGNLLACGRKEADFEDLDALRQMVHQARADIIVNAAAYTAVDKAESEPQKARRINSEAVGVLAEEAAYFGAWLVHYSTDYVFDGANAGPYVETDRPNPLSVYGKTKLEGEERIRDAGVKHLIFRTSWIHALQGRNFVKTILQLARERDEFHIVADQIGAPTSADLVADVTALALYRLQGMPDAASLSGTYHLTANGQTSWYDYAQYMLALAQVNGLLQEVKPVKVNPISSDAYPTAAKRPQNSCLNTSKLECTFQLQLPNWRHHVRRLVDELTIQKKA